MIGKQYGAVRGKVLSRQRRPVVLGGLSAKRIPKPDLRAVITAIIRATDRHGHPYDVPLNGLEGIDPETADVCFALLASEPFPVHHTAATAKWLRLVGAFSSQIPPLPATPPEQPTADFE